MRAGPNATHYPTKFSPLQNFSPAHLFLPKERGYGRWFFLAGVAAGMVLAKVVML